MDILNCDLLSIRTRQAEILLYECVTTLLDFVAEEWQRFLIRRSLTLDVEHEHKGVLTELRN
jgi:hypothetical protein